jgi:hypothetical protein
MKLWLSAAVIGLVLAGQAQAADLSCDEALSRVDTFGRLRWKDRVKTVPAWAVDVSCPDECAYADPEGVRYGFHGEYMLDKELTGAKVWPWGLKANDGPAEVKAKLARLLPGDPLAAAPHEAGVYFLNIADCMVWIEVAFDGERGIKAVSLNAQP